MEAITRAQLLGDWQAKHRAKLALPRFENGWTQIDSLLEFRAAAEAERAALAALHAFDATCT